jgi:hypothetical protein
MKLATFAKKQWLGRVDAVPLQTTFEGIDPEKTQHERRKWKERRIKTDLYCSFKVRALTW